MNTQNRLRIAVQKSGRLTDLSLALFKRCGLCFSRTRDRLVCAGENLPLDLMLVRDDDIPRLLAEGSCEAGVAGLNVLTEYALDPAFTAHFDLHAELDFGACRLALAVPEQSGVST